ncbi:methyl-accepting chemotaxis protein [Aliamphritea spongicola]|uniref:methyl-accepting chemotaxis protein n=1 Tax=Aliamphritea spongicola TaxID=707589 RepID=UPI00196A7F0C|nr:methyl-accepting chemotaxis protein [Aliamphritea spongicola]MBN3564226.1 methyl-accepting chemotaxis protein [Aliamphritea spongicola]
MLKNLSLRAKLGSVLILTLLSCAALAYAALTSINQVSSSAGQTIQVNTQLAQLQELRLGLFEFERAESHDLAAVDALVLNQSEQIASLSALATEASLAADAQALEANYNLYIDNLRKLAQLNQTLGLSDKEGLRQAVNVVGDELTTKVLGALKPIQRDTTILVNIYFEQHRVSQHDEIRELFTKFKAAADEINLYDFYQESFEAYVASFDQADTVVTDIRNTRQAADEQLGNIRTNVQNLIQQMKSTVLQKVEADMQNTISDARLMVTGGGLLLAAILFVLIFNIARTITASMSSIIDCLEGIGAGNLSLRLPINEKRNDEFDRTANAVNHMADELEGIVGQVKNTSLELTNAAGVLHTSIEQVSQTTDQVTGQTTTVASATEEMSATLQDLTNTTNDADSMARQSFETAVEGSKVIDRAVNSFTETATLFSQVDQEIQELNQHSSKVDSITDMISDIANQTGLLALNAAIEAARAGEQGRGFAVVADEVRTLAEKTVHATADITSIVDSMATLTRSLIKSMESARECISVGQGHSEEALAVVSAINEGIQGVTDRNHQVAVGIEEMARVTQEISANMEEIAGAMVESNQYTSDIRDQSVQVSSRGQELVESAECFQVEARQA